MVVKGESISVEENIYVVCGRAVGLLVSFNSRHMQADWYWNYLYSFWSTVRFLTATHAHLIDWTAEAEEVIVSIIQLDYIIPNIKHIAFYSAP